MARRHPGPLGAWPEIIEAMPEAGPVCIEASAGTGKTYTLEHLILKLVVDDGLPLERVLMVTFTEKAARELTERVRARLLQSRTTLDSSEHPEAPLARRRVDAALRTFDRASIRTIHGFCQDVLREGALPAGLPLDQRLVDRRAVADEVLRELLRERIDGDDATGAALRAFIEADGLEALQEFHAQLAGQHGTRVPTWDLEGFRALARSAPDRASLEAWSGAKGLPRAGAPVKALFVEGFAALPSLADALDSDLAALASPNPWALWCADTGAGKTPRIKVLRTWLAKPKVLAHPLAARLDALLEGLLAHPLAPGVFLADAFFGEVKARADARKLSQGLIDYDAMLERLAQALEGPAGERLAASVRARFSFVLIDEFQDTDALQWGIFERLFGGRPEHRLVVVGDPKQAIYAFRGGDLPVYLEARRKIALSGNPPLRLSTSYRSTPRLLEALGAIFSDHYFEAVGGAPSPTKQTAPAGTGQADPGTEPPAAPFTVDALDAPPLAAGRPDDTLLDASSGDPMAPLLLLTLPNDRGAAAGGKAAIAGAIRAAVADEILRLTGAPGPALLKQGEAPPRPLGPGDCMVLCLSGRECEAMGETLRLLGIPHAFFKREGLAASPEADALRLLLAALANPRDRSARARLWLSPFFELPLAKLEAARELPATSPLNTRIDAWAELASRRRFERLFDAVLVESGLLRRLALTRDERALTNFQHLCEQLLEAARAEPLTIDDLWRRLLAGKILGTGAGQGGREADLRRLETERDAVLILTLHAAKGLEAPAVFLAFSPAAKSPSRPGPSRAWSPKIFHEGPARRVLLSAKALGGQGIAAPEAQATAEAEQERRRLFYVAATRPMARLVLPAFPAPDDDPTAGPLHFVPGYACLNARLLAAAARPELSDHFETRPLEPFFDAAASPGPSPAPSAGVIAALLPLPETSPPPGAPDDLDRLRASRKAPLLTSFSRMSRGDDARASEFTPSDLVPTELTRDALLASTERHSPELSGGLTPEGSGSSDPALPGGVDTGLFLHDLLETLDFDKVAALADRPALLEDPDARARAVRLATRHGLPETAATRGLELAFFALRTPRTLGDVSLARGLCGVEHHRSELPFVYPLPEPSHPLLGSRAAASPPGELSGGGQPGKGGLAASGDAALPFRVDRGFVTGFIDLVFEHEGRVFFLDWKSNRLPDYAPAALADHVKQHYALQARLYTLAVTRLYGLRDAASYEATFGGLVYLYLRGGSDAGLLPSLDPTHEANRAGLYFERPSFEALAAWERGLLDGQGGAF